MGELFRGPRLVQFEEDVVVVDMEDEDAGDCGRIESLKGGVRIGLNRRGELNFVEIPNERVFHRYPAPVTALVDQVSAVLKDYPYHGNAWLDIPLTPEWVR